MSTAKLEDSTQRPLYGERIIEESKIICFDNPNKKRIYEISIQLPEFTNAIFTSSSLNGRIIASIFFMIKD